MRPRIRTLKPEFFRDERLSGLTTDARLLMVGLITMADDEGRLQAAPIMIAGHCFPFEEKTIKLIPRWLDELAEAGLIVLYEHKGIPHVAIRSWAKNQRINRPSPSDLPPPPDAEIVANNSITGYEKPNRPRISDALRRAVAKRSGAEPGEVVDIECHYCGYIGRAHWRRLSSGKPGSWVTFEGLELDHVISVEEGGDTSEDNLVLACTRCNRSKGSGPVADFRDPSTGSRTALARDPVEDASRVGARSAPIPFAGNPSTAVTETAEIDTRDESREIFEAWMDSTGRHPDRTKFSSDRRRRIDKARLSHGFEACLLAVQNIGRDAWARGENDRGQRYDDIEHALGTAARIERWRDWTPRTLHLTERQQLERHDAEVLTDALREVGA